MTMTRERAAAIVAAIKEVDGLWAQLNTARERLDELVCREKDGTHHILDGRKLYKVWEIDGKATYGVQAEVDVILDEETAPPQPSGALLVSVSADSLEKMCSYALALARQMNRPIYFSHLQHTSCALPEDQDEAFVRWRWEKQNMSSTTTEANGDGR